MLPFAVRGPRLPTPPSLGVKGLAPCKLPSPLPVAPGIAPSETAISSAEPSYSGGASGSASSSTFAPGAGYANDPAAFTLRWRPAGNGADVARCVALAARVPAREARSSAPKKRCEAKALPGNLSSGSGAAAGKTFGSPTWPRARNARVAEVGGHLFSRRSMGTHGWQRGDGAKNARRNDVAPRGRAAMQVWGYVTRGQYL